MASYNEYRGNIKSGDTLVWSVKKWETLNDVLVQGVRTFTRSEYCHVGIAWEIGGRLMVVEAVPPQVRIYPLSKLLPFYHLPMDIAWNPTLDEMLIARVGEDYSIWQALVSYLKKPSEDNQWQCVELMQDFYKRIGIETKDVYVPTEFVEALLEQSKNGLVLVS